MATYTDISSFKADFYPDRVEVAPRFIDRAATAVYNWINAELSRFYTVPFSATYPPLIVDISDFATKAVTDFLIKKGRMPKVKEIAKDSPFDPMRMLEKLIKNEMELLDSSGDVISRKSGTAPWTNMSGKIRVFDRDHEFNWRVDTTDLDALEDEREAHET